VVIGAKCKPAGSCEIKSQNCNKYKKAWQVLKNLANPSKIQMQKDWMSNWTSMEQLVRNSENQGVCIYTEEMITNAKQVCADRQLQPGVNQGQEVKPNRMHKGTNSC